MPASRYRRFCRALLEETGGEVLRWTSIDSVADRLGMDPDKAAVMAADLAELDLVRVGGGHSVWLAETGRQACDRTVKKPAVRRPSKRSGKARAKARVGRST